MSTVAPMHTVATLPREVAQYAGMIGSVVTVGERQYTVHSVEGRTFYAFDQDGQTTVDVNMTPAEWIKTPIALILPMGTKIGQGSGVECEVNRLHRGVCLTKW